jgi:hypothetical protein
LGENILKLFYRASLSKARAYPSGPSNSDREVAMVVFKKKNFLKIIFKVRGCNGTNMLLLLFSTTLSNNRGVECTSRWFLKGSKLPQIF